MEGTNFVSGSFKKQDSTLLTAGNLIAYWRKRRQGKQSIPLSIIELAKLSGISTAALRQYESGKVPPTKRLFVIASALDIPPHVLLAPMWRKTREEMSLRRKALGFASPLPDTQE